MKGGWLVGWLVGGTSMLVGKRRDETETAGQLNCRAFIIYRGHRGPYQRTRFDTRRNLGGPVSFLTSGWWTRAGRQCNKKETSVARTEPTDRETVYHSRRPSSSVACLLVLAHKRWRFLWLPRRKECCTQNKLLELAGITIDGNSFREIFTALLRGAPERIFCNCLHDVRTVRGLSIPTYSVLWV